ncbi:MAG: L,D-transpeptidase [Pseudomonadota bacterium]
MVHLLIVLLGVVGAFSPCFSSPAGAEDSSQRVSRSRENAATVQGRRGPGNLESVPMTGRPGRYPRHDAKIGPRKESSGKTAVLRHVSLVKASAGREVEQTTGREAYAGTLPGSVGEALFKGLPEMTNGTVRGEEPPRTPPPAFRPPALVSRKQMQALLMPGDHLKSVGKFMKSREGKFSRLEIEVSHSLCDFRLLGLLPSGKKDVLYECKVGLGSREFPTPEGHYYVTHIYDRDPWWIPPANRAWAVGQSPSRKVYGGVMAPLLKKRPIGSGRQKQEGVEDKIDRQVRLEDYDYRFHGTNAPRSIGHRQSHGCVRMLPKDVKNVSELIKKNVDYVERLESNGSSIPLESVNGSFVLLKSPIRFNIVK